MGIDFSANTMLINSLHFGYERRGFSDYGKETKLKYCTMGEAMEFYLKVIVSGTKPHQVTPAVVKPKPSDYVGPYMFITSVVDRTWFGDHQLMILDCDSEDEMLATCHWLKTECGIMYDLIQSGTPGHHWVVTDYVGKWKDIYKTMSIIPGVCTKYKEYCIKYKKMAVRAFPKIINGKPNKPVFPNEVNITDFVPRQWLLAIKAYYDSEYYKKLMKAVYLCYCISEGKMSHIAADPGFEL
jgi:hypothetical protein